MQFDVVIVGGGLVGTSLAVALQTTSLRIALINAREPSNDDPRLFALNAGSCDLLRNIKIWPEIAEHATAIHQVHVSHQGHFGSVRLRNKDVNLSSLGHVIPAKYIETALQQMLSSAANIHLFQPATLQTIAQENEFVILTIHTNQGVQTIKANIVIGADGTDSTVRNELGIDTEVYDYEQAAIVTKTTLSRSHHYIAHERFVKDSAIAMLPLADQTCATIWSGSKQQIAQLLELSDTEFLVQLQQQFGYRLGKLKSISSRYHYPLRMVRAKQTQKDRVMLLGNSAHTLHPIAAQGFNLALYEVAVLVDAINQALQKGAELNMHLLTTINDDLQKQQSMSIGISHRLTRWFSKNDAIKNMLLPMSMVTLQLLTPIKKLFIKQMTARLGTVPTLLLSKDL